MNRRVIAAVAAVVLALVGGLLLFTYVQSADARALAGQQPTSVLVVTKPIVKGTSAEEARRWLTVEQLPAVAVVEGSVDSFDDIAGLVAAVDLVEGEQVLASRFVDPSSGEANDLVTVPDGMEQVSIVLEPQRVIGSHLVAGDTVGVMGSFEIKDAKDPSAEAIQTTHLVLNKVLVTRVQGVVATQGRNADQATNEAPSDSVMVTLAVSAGDAERIVFAQEWGKIWLTLQREDSDQKDSRIVTAGNIYR